MNPVFSLFYLTFMIIDFRSDTVTRPSAAMLEAMMNAEVGDDVFQEDPTVNKLESMAAEYVWDGSCFVLPNRDNE